MSSHYLKDIFDLIGDYKKHLIRLFLFFLLSAFFDLAGLSLIAPYLTLITTPDSEPSIGLIKSYQQFLPDGCSVILAFSWVLVIVSAAKLASSIYVNYRIQEICGNFDANLRREFLIKLQSMPYSEWLQRNSSEYITVVNAHVPIFVAQVLSPSLRALSDTVISLVVLAFLAYTDWRGFLVLSLMFSIVGFAYNYYFRARLSIIGAEQRVLSIELTTNVRHAMEGFKELRVLGSESYFTKGLQRNANKWAQGQAKSQAISRMPRYLAEFVLILFVVASVGLSRGLNGTTENLTVVFGVFALGAMRLIPALSGLMALGGQLRMQRSMVQRLASDWREFSFHPQKVVVGNTLKIEKFENLQATSIYFRYPNAKSYTIEGASLRLDAGESVAFVGTSGSGKTTMVDILLGLLKPSGGELLVNGKSLVSNARWFLDQVAYLPQQVFLIDDTLCRNVALGREDCDIEIDSVSYALRQAQLSDLVARLPHGIYTVIGDKGLRLSGGERQRVALARAFYFKRSIIVMDEATSALDGETEREIVEEINLLKGKTTLIVIAHRLETVQACDKIYEVNSGKVLLKSRSQDDISISVQSNDYPI
jgi:ABC-type multidrug transport system fused ATPase/permease subunit